MGFCLVLKIFLTSRCTISLTYLLCKIEIQYTMRRSKKNLKENDLLIEEVRYTGEIDNPTEIKVIQYDEAGWSEKELHPDKLPAFEEGGVKWIRVNGLNDVKWITQLANRIHLPQLGLQDVLQPQIIARIEAYDDLLQINMKHHVFSETGKIETEQVTIILGRGFVVSFQETDNHLFEDIIKAIEVNTVKIRSRQADYLFLLLVNHLLAVYVDHMNKLEDIYEAFEDKLLDSYNTDDNFLTQLKIQRARYQTIKQSILPLKDGFYKIRENEDELFSQKDMIYINAVYEQFNYLTQSLEVCRESFDVLVNLYISNNDLRMNEIMKRLTVITAVFIPLTFLVGVWGMNYEHMPELKLTFGYLIAWVIMLLVGMGTWWFMRSRKWY